MTPNVFGDEWTGDVWFFNYDAANRRTSVVYPDGSATFTSYDAAGQVVEQRAVAATGWTSPGLTDTFIRGNPKRVAIYCGEATRRITRALPQCSGSL